MAFLAVVEIAHAIDRYETEREGLGAEFWDELRTAIRTLEHRDRSVVR